MRFYVRAQGSTCYNREGLTYPTNVPIDFPAWLKAIGATRAGWEREFGWSNQPPVLSFDLPHIKSRFDRRMPDYALKLPAGLFVVQHWNSVPQTDREG